MPLQTLPSNPLTPEQLMIDRAIRELQQASGFGVIALTFKDNALVEVQVSYTRKVKLERSGQTGSD